MERTVLSPVWRERLLFNPDERTKRALETLETDPAKATQALETARRLSGNDPLASYNAGTGHLAAEHLQVAAQHLESAAQGAEGAERADGQVASVANYNLGNARFATQDLPAAIEAYKQALRHNPDLEDAKHNLELSQRLLKKQQWQQDQGQQNQDQQDQKQDRQNQDQDQQDQEQQDQDQQDQDQQDQDQQDQDQQQDHEQQEGPLPQFEDLPDMSAEEAAAILEAIENMERDQRRQEALAAAKTSSGKKKDW